MYMYLINECNTVVLMFGCWYVKVQASYWKWQGCYWKLSLDHFWQSPLLDSNLIQVGEKLCLCFASRKQLASEHQFQIKRAKLISQLEREIDDYPENVCCNLVLEKECNNKHAFIYIEASRVCSPPTPKKFRQLNTHSSCFDCCSTCHVSERVLPLCVWTSWLVCQVGVNQ